MKKSLYILLSLFLASNVLAADKQQPVGESVLKKMGRAVWASTWFRSPGGIKENIGAVDDRTTTPASTVSTASSPQLVPVLEGSPHLESESLQDAPTQVSLHPGEPRPQDVPELSLPQEEQSPGESLAFYSDQHIPISIFYVDLTLLQRLKVNTRFWVNRISTGAAYLYTNMSLPVPSFIQTSTSGLVTSFAKSMSQVEVENFPDLPVDFIYEKFDKIPDRETFHRFSVEDRIIPNQKKASSGKPGDDNVYIIRDYIMGLRRVRPGEEALAIAQNANPLKALVTEEEKGPVVRWLDVRIKRTDSSPELQQGQPRVLRKINCVYLIKDKLHIIYELFQDPYSLWIEAVCVSRNEYEARIKSFKTVLSVATLGDGSEEVGQEDSQEGSDSPRMHDVSLVMKSLKEIRDGDREVKEVKEVSSDNSEIKELSGSTGKKGISTSLPLEGSSLLSSSLVGSLDDVPIDIFLEDLTWMANIKASITSWGARVSWGLTSMRNFVPQSLRFRMQTPTSGLPSIVVDKATQGIIDQFTDITFDFIVEFSKAYPTRKSIEELPAGKRKLPNIITASQAKPSSSNVYFIKDCIVGKRRVKPGDEASAIAQITDPLNVLVSKDEEGTGSQLYETRVQSTESSPELKSALPRILRKVNCLYEINHVRHLIYELACGDPYVLMVEVFEMGIDKINERVKQWRMPPPLSASSPLPAPPPLSASSPLPASSPLSASSPLPASPPSPSQEDKEKKDV